MWAIAKYHGRLVLRAVETASYRIVGKDCGLAAIMDFNNHLKAFLSPYIPGFSIRTPGKFVIRQLQLLRLLGSEKSECHRR
ncbi:protein of unknown function (plasmid) [Cupriavidus taiwanensis]|uniref:Uncharacterized protein n=1 Tax=Cupriavidus taiwanensis TaxID=164546 RepID=A0A9Q7UUQ2_9BURK|nr:protein of unknown function [Cupriavidus taiwanensis]